VTSGNQIRKFARPITKQVKANLNIISETVSVSMFSDHIPTITKQAQLSIKAQKV